MIRNSRELKITQEKLEGLKKRLEYLRAQSVGNSFTSSEIFGVDAISNQLVEEIEWYRKAECGALRFDRIDRVEDINEVITGKRIQLSLSEEDLARSMGIGLEEYNDLAYNDFAQISTSLLKKTCNVLSIECDFLYSRSELLAKATVVKNNLKDIGRGNKVIQALLPHSFAEILEAVQKKGESALILFQKYIEEFYDLFRVDISIPVTQYSIQSSLSVAYKHPINIQGQNLTFITAFAANAAWLLMKKCDVKFVETSADPINIRRNIIEKFKDMSFTSCLKYTWDLGIIVLPLNIPNGFHGACFIWEGKRVVVLNQQDMTISRWKFDLLHELYHALTMKSDVFLEETDVFQSSGSIEKTASTFAQYVIFGSEADAYVEIVLQRSQGYVQNVRNSIISVASEYNLNLDDFANYMAYKISSKEVNIWGMAQNLQRKTESPYQIAQAELLSRVPLGDIRSSELLMLQQALSERTW